MGKLISARLATDDYDPMNLLGTTGVFSPRKHRTIKINKKNEKPSTTKKISVRLIKKKSYVG